MRLGLALAAVMTMASPAAASTYSPVTTKCPVGGQTFTYMGYSSYSRWGALPDGQPVGSAQFPITLPQCPDNGLVLFDDFDKATVAKLTPIVLGPDYQALRRTETRYYLAWWLRGRLGETGVQPLWTLLAATWEAKNGADAAQVTRYAEEFVSRVKALPADPGSMEIVALQARAANALRELGRFGEAEALRASIAIGETAGGTNDDAAKNRDGWRSYLAGLAPVIARRDATRRRST